MLERGEPGDGGADVLRRPQHGGVEDQAEHAGLVLHPAAVRLVEGAALAVAHVPGEPVGSVARSGSGAFAPSAYRAGAAVRFGGTCDNLSRPSRYAPTSSTRSGARANAVPVVRVGGRRGRSSSEDRNPPGGLSVATRSPGSAGSAWRAAFATVACSLLSATVRAPATCRASTDTSGSRPR